MSETETKMRQFATGATRNIDTSRLDFEGFLAPGVMKRYAEFMHKNRRQADGMLRDSDNWQKGIPQTAYMKSGFRHFFEWWEAHRERLSDPRVPSPEQDAAFEDAMCALLFNVQGYLFEHLKAKRRAGPVTEAYPAPEYPSKLPLLARHAGPHA